MALSVILIPYSVVTDCVTRVLAVAVRTFFTPACDSFTPSPTIEAEMARSERPFLPQFNDTLDRVLLLWDFDESSLPTDPPAEWDDAAEIAQPLSLIGLHVADALANAVPLGFGYGREDRKDELRDTVPGHVAA
jgi:hypothetical protein